MNTIIAVFALFVGAAVTAPQGPAQYQPGRPVVKANYPYRTPAPSAVPEAERFPPPPSGLQVSQPVDARFEPQPGRPVVKANYPYRPLAPSAVPEAERFPPPPPPSGFQVSQPVDARFKPQPYSVITKQSQEDNFDGSFNYNFEADNGIAVQGSGFLKNAGTEDEAQVIQGTYSYIAPDGTPIQTNWYADETGFHAEGAHLPVAPPLPEAIEKLVAFHRSLPQTDERAQKGQE